MTVNRFRDGEFAEVNKVGNPLEDASVLVRRDGEWDEIWPGVTVVEDFERDDPLDDYTRSSAFDTTSTTVFEGDTALTANGGSLSRINSISGLPAYPIQGDVFDCRLRLEDSCEARVKFGVEDVGNKYGINIQSDDNGLDLYKRDDGSFTRLTSTSVAVPQDEWLRLETTWKTNDTITVTLFDSDDSQLAEISTTDATHADRDGIGWGVRNGGPVFFDIMQITGDADE